MSARAGPRPGGRSARVQASVHAAARDLLKTMDRASVTVPLIAARAGVTPSTIYRRWGDLQRLLADIAVERFSADLGPMDTGGGATDLLAWAEQYADEMASGPGREMIKDMLSAHPENRCQCWAITRQQIAVIADRAAERGEVFPSIDVVMDRVVAPILCGILFAQPAASAERIRALVDGAMGGARRAPQRSAEAVA